jgi:hypothetical protein
MFELDLVAAKLRQLPVTAPVNCREGGGPISPDGKRIISHIGKALSLVRLETGAARVIKGVDAGEWSASGLWLSSTTWSPDGRWIAVIRDGRIILIDTDDASRRKTVGGSVKGPVQWSPDSKYLLFTSSQLRCARALYFTTLETIEVETGKTTVINDSRCSIGPGAIGWVNSEITQ